MYAIARATTLDIGPWRELIGTLDDLFYLLNRRTQLICGRFGEGQPTLTDALICFNGNANRRDWWKMQSRNTPRTDDAHEDFYMPRLFNLPNYHTGTDDLETARKPYTLAVRATLLLTRHYFPRDTTITAADCTIDQWYEAYELAKQRVPALQLAPECFPRMTPLAQLGRPLIYHALPSRAPS